MSRQDLLRAAEALEARGLTERAAGLRQMADKYHSAPTAQAAPAPPALRQAPAQARPAPQPQAQPAAPTEAPAAPEGEPLDLLYNPTARVLEVTSEPEPVSTVSDATRRAVATAGMPREFQYMARGRPSAERIYIEPGPGMPRQARGREVDLTERQVAASRAMRDYYEQQRLYYLTQQEIDPELFEPQEVEALGVGGMLPEAVQRLLPGVGRRTVRPTPEALAERDLANKLVIDEGLSIERAREAARRAKEDLRGLQDIRMDVTGAQVRTGIPESKLRYALTPSIFRESNIRVVRERDPQNPERDISVQYYRDPYTGEFTTPTTWQMLRESMARQVFPADVGENIRMQRAADRQRRLLEAGPLREPEADVALQAIKDEPLLTGLLTTIKDDSEVGLVAETPTSQMLRLTGIVPTAVNTALFELVSPFYEVGEDGKPLDETDVAYRIDQGLREALRFVGYSEEEIEAKRTGAMQIRTPSGRTILPVPFQPSTRLQPTGMDPAGLRVARRGSDRGFAGELVADYADALRVGRSMGDELMSIPAFVSAFDDQEEYKMQPGYGVLQDKYLELQYSTPTAPFWMGLATEMPYGLGPVSALRGAARAGLGGVQTGARRVKAAAQAKGAAGVAKAADLTEKAAYVAAHPAEAANTAKSIRLAQELAEGNVEGLDDLSILKGLNDVQRVAGEQIAEEVIAPYVLRARMQSLGPGWSATVGEVSDLAANSRVARKILDDVGLLNAPRGRLLTAAERSAIEQQTALYVAASRRLSIAETMASTTLSVQDKARSIVDELQSLGIKVTTLPRGFELLQATSGKRALGAQQLSDIVDDMLVPMVDMGVLPVQGRAPVSGTLHDLGQQIVQRAGSREAKAFDGTAGRTVNRRLADEVIDGTKFPGRAEEVLRAASSAGGRVVESTLEEMVPKGNMTAVTKSLMVPTNKLTNDVYAGVRRIMEPLRPVRQKGPVISGTSSDVFIYPRNALPAFIEAVGAGNIQRSEVLSRIAMDMQAGRPVTQVDYELVTDILETNAFRKVMGDEAREMMFTGQQRDIAATPVVERGFRMAPEERVKREGNITRMFRDLGTIVEIGGGAAIGRAFRDVAKRAGQQVEEVPTKFPELTDATYGRMNAEIKDQIGAVSENIRAEIRDTRIQTGDPEAAFNTVLARRLEQQLNDVTQSVDERAQQLVQAFGMDPKEAYFYVAYQRAPVTGAPGLGQDARRSIPDNIADIARDAERVFVARKAWDDWLRSFFGQEGYDELLGDLDVAEFIAAPGVDPSSIMTTADVRPFTTDQMREVLRLVRERKTSARGRGMSSAPFAEAFGVPTRDGVFPAALGWAVESDVNAIRLRAQRRAAAEAPGLYTDIMPSLYSSNPGRVAQEQAAMLTQRRGQLDTLNRLYEDRIRNKPGFFRSPLRATTGSLRYDEGVVDGIGQQVVDRSGQQIPALRQLNENGAPTDIVTKLDVIAGNYGLRLNAQQRMNLANEVYEHMVLKRRAVPDYDELLRNISNNKDLSLTTFDTAATVNAIEVVMNALDLQWARSTRGSDPVAAYRAVPVGDEDLFQQDLQGLFDGSLADATLYQHILAARSMGVKDETIVGALRDDMVRSAFDTYVRPLVDDVQGARRTLGFTPGTDRRDVDAAVRQLELVDPKDARLAMYGPEFAKAVEELKKAGQSGVLTANVEALRRRDLATKAFKGGTGTDRMMLGLHAIGSVASAARRVASGGMLAGPNFSLGNWRYIGTNDLTAPLLAMTTVGPVNAVRMLSGPGLASQSADFIQELPEIIRKPLVNARAPANPDDIVFTSKTGRQWTRAELDAAIRRNNILISRGAAEYTDSFVKEVMRDAQLTADSLPAGKVRRFARRMDPTMQSYFQQFANATDRVFRENMFASALRQGMTEEQAAKMARAVVLDYADMNPLIKNYINRYVMFASFRIANYTESIRALARSPDNFVRSLNALDNSQQQEYVAMFGPDYVRLRPMFTKVYDFEGAGSAGFGPTVTYAEAYSDMARLAAYAAGSGTRGGRQWGKDLLGLASEEALIPAIANILDQALDARDLQDPGGRVPSEELTFLMQSPAAWEFAKSAFNLKPVEGEAGVAGRARVMDPRQPQMGFREYRFNKVEDEMKYNMLLLALTYTSIVRQRRFLTKLGETADPGPYVDPTRAGFVPMGLYGIGALTPINTDRMERAFDRVLREQESTAKKHMRQKDQ